MSANLFYRTLCQICLGVLLVASVPYAVAAEWLFGTVTTFNPQTRSIGIDGLTFTLTASAGYPTAKEFKRGQAVRYEADGKLIKRIEVIQLPPT